MERRNWDRSELVVAFHQYCITPFGQMRHENPEIIELAAKLGRTPSALSMKMCNFASFDPVHQKRNVKGLANAAKGDRLIWDEFYNNWESLLEAYGEEAERYEIGAGEDIESDILELPKETETVMQVRVRTAQSFFRRSVLANYDYRCTMCQIDNLKLLNAGHIIPWSVDESKRADPENGLALCALHDRAFDRGLLTIDEDHRIVLSGKLRVKTDSVVHRVAFSDMEGAAITLPRKFGPARDALEWHRNNVFVA